MLHLHGKYQSPPSTIKSLNSQCSNDRARYNNGSAMSTILIWICKLVYFVKLTRLIHHCSGKFKMWRSDECRRLQRVYVDLKERAFLINTISWFSNWTKVIYQRVIRNLLMMIGWILVTGVFPSIFKEEQLAGILNICKVADFRTQLG